MTFRVLWSPHAEQRLEQMLQDLPERDLLAATVREIDQNLFADPTGFGESRYDTVRIGFVHPLGIQFEVMDDVRTVIVYDVWRFDRK
ncbi:MAG: hypothetical protein K8T91_13645 [Planctomycetes bacterium]|nr:hypothetical protein [Planctomycetota bacterium]